MALTFTGASGVSSATIPTHAAGDLIVAFAFRDGSNTAPALPTGQNWTDLGTTGANTCAVRMAKKTAASAAESTGTFNNSTNFIVIVVKTDISGGIVVLNTPTFKTGATATVSSDSRSIENPHSSSRMLSWLGSRSAIADVTLDAYVPTGYTRIHRHIPASNFAVVWSSNATVTTYGGWSTTSEEALGWITANAEVYDYDPAASGLTDTTVADISGETVTVGVSTTNTTDPLYVVVTSAATQPNSAQIIAGQDHLGNAAAFAANDATPLSGANTFAATGLTPGATYYAHFYQSGASIVTSDPWTMLSYPVLGDPLVASAIGQEAATIDVDTDTGSGTIYVVVTESAVEPTPAQVRALTDENDAVPVASASDATLSVGVNSIVVSGLTDGTQYYAYAVQETWGLSTVSSVAFQTEAVIPGVVVTLRDMDTDVLLNAVTFSTVHVFDPLDRDVPLGTDIGVTTDGSGVLTVIPSALTKEQINNSVDLVGWNVDGSIRFHATGTIVDTNA